MAYQKITRVVLRVHYLSQCLQFIHKIYDLILAKKNITFLYFLSTKRNFKQGSINLVNSEAKVAKTSASVSGMFFVPFEVLQRILHPPDT